MAFIHGKNTFLSIAGDDISTWTDASEIEESAESHVVTAYGKNSHVKSGGLFDGKFTCSGTVENTAITGTRAVLKPLKGTVVEVIRQPEGTGSGLPQDKFNCLVTKFVESSPVADMVKWSLEGEISDDVDSTAQPA